MTTPQVLPDPSQAPGASVTWQSAARASRGWRPGGLTAVCVIAICLGALGLGSSLLSLGGLAFQKQLQQAFTPAQPSGTANPGLGAQIAAQRLMQDKIQAIGDRYRTANMALALLNLLVAGGLLAGGIMTLTMKPRGHTLLVWALALAIAFVAARGTIYVFQQMEMWPVIAEFSDRTMQAVPKGPAGAGPPAAMMKTIMTASLAVGLVIALGMDLAKVVFYAFGIHYLRRPNIRRLFDPASEGFAGP